MEICCGVYSFIIDLSHSKITSTVAIKNMGTLLDFFLLFSSVLTFLNTWKFFQKFTFEEVGERDIWAIYISNEHV